MGEDMVIVDMVMEAMELEDTGMEAIIEAMVIMGTRRRKQRICK